LTREGTIDIDKGTIDKGTIDNSIDKGTVLVVTEPSPESERDREPAPVSRGQLPVPLLSAISSRN